MKNKNNNQTDVLELDAEEIPLEKVIDNTLVKHNVTDAVIASLKEKYGNLRLRSIDDKETYLEIVSARKEVRKVGILVEKVCEHGREDAIKIQRLWLAKQKEVSCKVLEVQNPLDSEIKKFDDEVERKEIEAAKKREEIYMNRQTVLSKLGATYNNGSFVLNHISYEVELIKQSDDDMWNDTILPKYKKVYEEIEVARVQEENKRKAEQEELKRQREEFEAQQKAFREQQELFQKQQAELEKQKGEAERKDRERQLQEQRLIDAANEKKWRDRLSQLNEIGWNGQFAFPRLGSDEMQVFTYDELVNLPDDIFNERAKEYNDSTVELKKQAEEKKAAKIEEDIRLAKEQAAQQERERIAEEQRLAEIKKKQEEQRKAEELALSGDKSMFADVISYLSNYPKHAMRSNIYKGKMNAIANFIENL